MHGAAFTLSTVAAPLLSLAGAGMVGALTGPVYTPGVSTNLVKHEGITTLLVEAVVVQWLVTAVVMLKRSFALTVAGLVPL